MSHRHEALSRRAEKHQPNQMEAHYPFGPFTSTFKIHLHWPLKKENIYQIIFSVLLMEIWHMWQWKKIKQQGIVVNKCIMILLSSIWNITGAIRGCFHMVPQGHGRWAEGSYVGDFQGDWSDVMRKLLVIDEFLIVLSYLHLFMTENYFKTLNWNWAIIILTLKTTMSSLMV